MSTDETYLPIAPETVPVHVENSTDARARSDIEIALGTVDELLAGDVEHLSRVTAADLSRWLESYKHLAETTPS